MPIVEFVLRQDGWASCDRLQAVPHRLRFKQLYHDGEEVTGHLVTPRR